MALPATSAAAAQEEESGKRWLLHWESLLRVLSALGAGLAMLNILYYARGIGGVGIVMRMVTSIISATVSFMIVFLVFLSAFMLAFWFLVDDGTATGHGTIA